MLIELRSVEGAQTRTLDGELGKVDDFTSAILAGPFATY